MLRCQNEVDMGFLEEERGRRKCEKLPLKLQCFIEPNVCFIYEGLPVTSRENLKLIWLVGEAWKGF